MNRAVLDREWGAIADSLVLHGTVALLGVAGFSLIAARWREFYALGPMLQWLTMAACWASVLLGFAACMILPGIL